MSNGHHINIGLMPHPRYGTLHVVVDPNPAYVRAGDFVGWVAGDLEWAVHFTPISPVVREVNGELRRVRRVKNGEGPIMVREGNAAGTYKYTVAVLQDGKIYTEDPELIDEGDEVGP